jgi:hypothetical protein
MCDRFIFYFAVECKVTVPRHGTREYSNHVWISIESIYISFVFFVFALLLLVDMFIFTGWPVFFMTTINFTEANDCQKRSNPLLASSTIVILPSFSSRVLRKSLLFFLILLVRPSLCRFLFFVSAS